MEEENVARDKQLIKHQDKSINRDASKASLNPMEKCKELEGIKLLPHYNPKRLAFQTDAVMIKH